LELQMSEFDHLLKLLVLGESNVGKSSLVLRYVESSFSDMYISTIGVDFKFKQFKTSDGKTVKIQIWDTAGQERFRTITQSYYRRANGVLVIFDLTDKKTFERIHEWMEEVKSYTTPKVSVVLVGNKCDKEDRVIDINEAKELAKSLGIEYVETSAKTGRGVDEAFMTLVNKILEPKINKTRSETNVSTVSLANESKSSKESKNCCG